MTGSLEGLPLPEATYGLVRRFLELTGLPVEECVLVVEPDLHGKGCVCRVDRRHPTKPGRTDPCLSCGKPGIGVGYCLACRKSGKADEHAEEAVASKEQPVDPGLVEAMQEAACAPWSWKAIGGCLACQVRQRRARKENERLTRELACARRLGGDDLGAPPPRRPHVDQPACTMCHRQASDNVASELVRRGWHLLFEHGSGNTFAILCPVCWATLK